jgi:hypothetical protein
VTVGAIERLAVATPLPLHCLWQGEFQPTRSAVSQAEFQVARKFNQLSHTSLYRIVTLLLIEAASSAAPTMHVGKRLSDTHLKTIKFLGNFGVGVCRRVHEQAESVVAHVEHDAIDWNTCRVKPLLEHCLGRAGFCEG